MKRIRNFSEYGILLESFSEYGLSEQDYERIVMRVKRSISKILMKEGIFGQVLAEIPVAISSKCKYFATDGTIFIFNPTNVVNLEEEEIIWAITQGIAHLALEHYDRIEGKDPEMWNKAADIAAEGFLDGIGKSKLPPSMRNPAYYDLSAEEIYKMIEDGKLPKSSLYESFCEISEPGEIDHDEITETILGDRDSITKSEDKEDSQDKDSEESEDGNQEGEETEDEGEGEGQDGEDSEGQEGESQDGEESDEECKECDKEGEGQDGEEGEGDGGEGDGQGDGEGKGEGKGKGEGEGKENGSDLPKVGQKVKTNSGKVGTIRKVYPSGDIEI